MNKRINYFKLILLFSSITIFENVSFSEMIIYNANSRSVSFTIENKTNDTLSYFNIWCFFTVRKIDKKGDYTVNINLDRANLMNDTLFLYLHNKEFYNLSYTEYKEEKSIGMWRDYNIHPNSKLRNYKISFVRKIKYSHLCIYYNEYFQSESNNEQCKRLVYSLKNKKTEILNVKPPLKNLKVKSELREKSKISIFQSYFGDYDWSL